MRQVGYLQEVYRYALPTKYKIWVLSSLILEVSLQIRTLAVVPGLSADTYSHLVEGMYGFKNFVVVLLTARNLG